MSTLITVLFTFFCIYCSIVLAHENEVLNDRNIENINNNNHHNNYNNHKEQFVVGGGVLQHHSKSDKIGFCSAFIESAVMIFATEIGDKTFFIAAIMAMKHERFLVLIGALTALWMMTILSVGIGYTVPQFIPQTLTHYAAAILFGYFGIKLIYESTTLKYDSTSEELEEVERELGYDQEIAIKDEGSQFISAVVDTTKKDSRQEALQAIRDAFVLTFLAEWGDRSQIATIAMGTSENMIGVCIGTCIGHAFCTGIAVQGGILLASRISEKTVAQIGGLFFLIFGVYEFVWG